MTDSKLTLGVKNLLFNCAQLEFGDNLLIISEKECLGWYNFNAAKSVKHIATSMGINSKIFEVNAPGNQCLTNIDSVVSQYDCAIFFARIGDQNRFEIGQFKGKRVMSYARSVDDLRSDFSTTNHLAMVDFKQSIDSIFLNAKTVEVICPNGTNISGKMLNPNFYKNSDVTMKRFPMLVPMPILTSSFNGKVLLANYLTSTGSEVYTPNFLKLSGLLSVVISNGQIIDLIGEKQDIVNFENHYKLVSEKFGLDKYIVHSWHAGIHPATKYDKSIDSDPDRWANTIFGNPHYLHFHTCGANPPGEICWMVEDPTIILDGKALWKNGVIMVEEFNKTKDCLSKWPELVRLFK